MISVGSPFPDFSLLNTQGETKTLQDFLGKWLVLYFYPKDDTPGCTIEGKSFSSMVDEFAAVQTQIVGVSKDTVASHAKFCAKHDLRVMLLSDPEKSLYAAAEIGTKKFMGRPMFKRSTYIIDPAGIVREAYDEVSPLGHAEEVLARIKELQAA